MDKFQRVISRLVMAPFMILARNSYHLVNRFSAPDICVLYPEYKRIFIFVYFISVISEQVDLKLYAGLYAIYLTLNGMCGLGREGKSEEV